MPTEGRATRQTSDKVGIFLDNPLHLLERLNDSGATVFLLLREARQRIRVSEIIKKTKVICRQVYRALQFLKSVDSADHIHGYWYEKVSR